MLTKLEGIPEGEEEPPHRWWLVLNVITGYALKGMGIQPEMRDFLVAAPEENDLRGIFSRQYQTIDFEHMHLEIYSLGARMPRTAHYPGAKGPAELHYHPYFGTGVMEIINGRALIDGEPKDTPED